MLRRDRQSLNFVEVIKRVTRKFRAVTAPLDWVEFAVFVLVAVATAALVIWAFLVGAIDGLRQRDWLKVSVSLLPLLLLAVGVINLARTQRVNWTLFTFLAIVGGLAFYFIYF